MDTHEAGWPAFTVPPLRGKVAIVTGGGKGIGASISSVLACDGADVVVCGRDVDALEEHVARLASEFPERDVAPLRCDVTDVDDVERLVSATVARFGGVDILVNAAGVTGPIETPPKRSTVALTRRSTSSTSVMSHRTGSTSRSGNADARRPTCSSSASTSRPQTTTSAPSQASTDEMLAPMPFPPPVTIATLPRRGGTVKVGQPASCVSMICAFSSLSRSACTAGP